MAQENNRIKLVFLKDYGVPMYLTEERIRRLYKSLDTDNKGYIDQEAIISHAYLDHQPQVGRRKRKFREMYAAELIKQCDRTRDGKITYDEFSDFLKRKEQDLLKLFSSMDIKSDGELSRKEIGLALNRAGISISELELTRFVQHIDTDNDGLIAFEEFVEFLLFFPRDATMKNIYIYYHNMVHQNDTADYILLPDDSKSNVTTFKYLIAGAFAGAVSRTSTAPLDRLRVLLQVQIRAKTLPKGISARLAFQLQETLRVCSKIYSDGGVLAFWRGNGVNVLKIVPESAIRFYVFEATKRYLITQKRQNSYRTEGGVSIDQKIQRNRLHLASEIGMKERLIAGGIAGFASQALIYPLDTIKTRMMAEIQASGSAARAHVSAVATAKKMLAKEGWRSFFRGIGPSLVGIIPYAGIDLTAYETLKTKYISYSGQKSPSPVVHLICGASAGALSASIVYPLGLIRTRLQAQGTSTHTQHYPRGAIDVIRMTYAQESWMGFYKGLAPSLIKVVPAVSLSYICYERAKKHMELP